MLTSILKRYGLKVEDCVVQQFESGLINKTWKISSGKKNCILQKINSQIFEKPEDIDKNLQNLKKYLKTHHPNYLFVAPIAASDGLTLIKVKEGYFRMFDFVDASHTINYVNTPNEAFEAARQFGKFSRLLSGFNADTLAYPLPKFHNLTLRYQQFIDVCAHADKGKIIQVKEIIEFIKANNRILYTYQKLVAGKLIPRRVVHHDTKISNVLFDNNGNGLCVIDLDTVMPGFYISDVGDMMRTYLSEANEEETNLDKVRVRTDFFRAIYKGYFGEMGLMLTPMEKDLFIYSGAFIIYMQAIRFLTDYLNNDIYYGAKYPEHNLNRAMNQIQLLKEYQNASEEFKMIIEETEKDKIY